MTECKLRCGARAADTSGASAARRKEENNSWTKLFCTFKKGTSWDRFENLGLNYVTSSAGLWYGKVKVSWSPHKHGQVTNATWALNLRQVCNPSLPCAKLQQQHSFPTDRYKSISSQTMTKLKTLKAVTSQWQCASQWCLLGLASSHARNSKITKGHMKFECTDPRTPEARVCGLWCPE